MSWASCSDPHEDRRLWLSYHHVSPCQDHLVRRCQSNQDTSQASLPQRSWQCMHTPRLVAATAAGTSPRPTAASPDHLLEGAASQPCADGRGRQDGPEGPRARCPPRPRRGLPREGLRLRRGPPRHRRPQTHRLRLHRRLPQHHSTPEMPQTHRLLRIPKEGFPSPGSRSPRLLRGPPGRRRSRPPQALRGGAPPRRPRRHWC
mmetsp:Transcript_12890/g.36714  ORF Transcript_12890/g.36714 Transcript_12890/m.36714 type:complete len:203 (-) Transcript_12890:138-746(-)